MSEKTAPIGVCDLCAGVIKADEWFTRRGPRRYCCVDCKNTANSRAGAPIRSDKAKERIASGQWQNPREKMTPEQISETQSRASRTTRMREVEEGRWRNPALADEAREKLSRPRKHTGALHSAIEKLRAGVRMSDMTEAEQDAYRAYTHDLRERFKTDDAYVAQLKDQHSIADLRVSRDVFGVRLDLWSREMTHAIPSFDPDTRRIEITPSAKRPRTYSVSQNGRRMHILARRLTKKYAIALGDWNLVSRNDADGMIFEKAL